MSLITDRTAADVERGNAKGRYNYTDLNRVELNVMVTQSAWNAAPTGLESLAEELGVGWDEVYRIPVDPLDLTIKTDWNQLDLPTTSAMERYLGNVETIQTGLEAAAEILAEEAAAEFSYSFQGHLIGEDTAAMGLELLPDGQGHLVLMIGVGPELPETMAHLTWQGANTIEAVLEASEAAIGAWYDRQSDKIERTAAAFPRSGRIYAGQLWNTGG